MDLPIALRGSSGRQGVFLTGKPQQLILFPDGMVVVSASVALGVASSGAVAGLSLDAVTTRALRGAKPSGKAYASVTKRAHFVPYGEISDVRLTAGFPSRKLTYVVQGKKHLHAYGKLGAADEVVVPVLERVFAGEFHNELPQQPEPGA
jgi:hypothetical protein